MGVILMGVKPEAEIKIRKMTIDDYNKTYQLWLNTSGMGLNSIDDSRDGISKYLLRNPDTCFIAEKEDEIIGAIMSGHDGRRGYIHHTAVKESERNQGIGSLLVQKAIDALKEEGINKAALVVFAENIVGNSFWENRGFSARSDLIYRNKIINEK